MTTDTLPMVPHTLLEDALFLHHAVDGQPYFFATTDGELGRQDGPIYSVYDFLGR